MIWVIDFNETIGKVMFISGILAFTMAHISLLFGKMKKTGTKIAFYSTLTLIFIVASILIYGILNPFEIGESFWRIIGFFAVLDVVGSIITPLLRKVSE